MVTPDLPTLGVVIVAFNSSDVILDCLESLMASRGARLRVVVVDNASTDNTVDLIRGWAAGTHEHSPSQELPFAINPQEKPLPMGEMNPGEALPDADLILLHARVNGGFAAGVNFGIAALAGDPDIGHFWVLNPDSVTPPDTAAAFAAHAAANPGYGMMGGRVCYTDPVWQIQIDGGTVSRWTGVCGNVNLGADHGTTPPPDPARFDFITGASMIVSRPFYAQAGPMVEDYFLYYEEVDWAQRRGALPFIYCPEGLVYHVGGSAIGSPTLGRFASPFSLYFKHRGRMRFIRRFNPAGLPIAWAYGMAKAAQMLIRGAGPEAMATLRATNGLPPPADVRNRLSPEAARIAF